MAEAIAVSGAISGTDSNLSFETGKLAALAGGAVTARLGDTVVLVTATAAKSVREGIDFFPLTVDVEERAYAAGKIPGSFFRREGKTSDNGILTCRLIDRPLRPSFPEGFRNEVHVVVTVLSADQKNPYDVLAINAASAALMISDVPFSGPIGAVRVACDPDGTWIPHPTYEQGAASTFEMVVAGRVLDDGDVAIMMVEAGGTEAAWDLYEDGAVKVDEAALAAGLEASKEWIKASCDLQLELLKAAGSKSKMDFPAIVDYSEEIMTAVAEAADRVAATQKIADKAERQAAEGSLRDEVIAELSPRFEGEADAGKQLKAAFRSLTKKIVRKRIVEEGLRIDGRGPRDLRPLSAEVAVLPTAHGSGLFQRGETQVLNVTTLGMARMDQMIDGIDPTTRKRYMHHYNFPPFSTGETGFMRGPKRREIGHGLLAERALVPVIPHIDAFPYTLRLVSDVLASNGSTSMASVCGSTLSLMDAGVPIKAPVAGIAMGLVFAEGKYTTLTDILGAEDAFGDMDFKVAGTGEFVTALQLDTKIDGIPADVLAGALEQAKEARLAILEVMAGAIAAPRPEVGEHAPKIISFEIPSEKIGEVIGPKGKVINQIQDETGAAVTVDDAGIGGVVSIASSDYGAVQEAKRQIMLIINPPTAGVGEVYMGKVVSLTKFGAFVNILPGRDGLAHISKFGKGKRLDSLDGLLELGQELEVRVDDVDPNGKIALTPTDPELANPDVGDRGGRGGGRERGSSDRGGDRGGDRDRGGRDRDRGGRGGGREGGRDRGGRDSAPAEAPAEASTARRAPSFEGSFDSEARQEFGDLGPEASGGRRG